MMEYFADDSSTSIHLTDIPTTMNNALKLIANFKEFGEILNVFTHYKKDPRAAVITFSKVEEAKTAFNSWNHSLKMKYIRLDSAGNSIDNFLRCFNQSQPTLITRKQPTSIASKDQNTAKTSLTLGKIKPELAKKTGVNNIVGIPTLAKKRAPKKSFDQKIQALKDDVKNKQEKYANALQAKKELNNELKAKITDLKNTKKENATLKEKIIQLSAEIKLLKGQSVNFKKLEEKYQYLKTENEKLRKMAF